MILELENVSKTYTAGETHIEAISEISLKINKPSSNLILGPTGSGKTTLINLINLLSPITDGEVRINGIYTSALTDKERSILRRQEVGIIHQRDNLFPFLNMVENVMVPQISGDKKEAIYLLHEMGFKAINKCPGQLSPYNQQKVALARALINKPSILLADEPTGELSPGESKEYIELLKKMSNEAVVLVFSNNPKLKKYFDNNYYLVEGKLSKNTGN